MKRRDFNRLVLAAGVSSAFAESSLAQMSAEEAQNPPAKAASPSIIIKNSPRSYNQVNVPRRYVSGKRRFTIYWTWSLSVGGQSRRHGVGQSFLHHD